MSRADIEQDFPALKGHDYDTSDEDFNNNCLGFALGDHSQWWEPPNGKGQYWPPGFADDGTVETVEKIIRLHGFIVELVPDAVPNADAVAIYAIAGEWTHFAKFSDGQWSCKLGEGHDVSRITLDDLSGSLYGTVVKILSRSISNETHSSIKASG